VTENGELVTPSVRGYAGMIEAGEGRVRGSLGPADWGYLRRRGPGRRRKSMSCTRPSPIRTSPTASRLRYRESAVGSAR
jgi:hypothetical protein